MDSISDLIKIVVDANIIIKYCHCYFIYLTLNN